MIMAGLKKDASTDSCAGQVAGRMQCNTTARAGGTQPGSALTLSERLPPSPQQHGTLCYTEEGGTEPNVATWGTKTDTLPCVLLHLHAYTPTPHKPPLTLVQVVQAGGTQPGSALTQSEPHPPTPQKEHSAPRPYTTHHTRGPPSPLSRSCTRHAAGQSHGTV